MPNLDPNYPTLPYQETNKLKNEVNKRVLHFLRTADPRPEPQVDKVGEKIRGEPEEETTVGN